jgi:exodeoxyribonuclease V beta subunit
VWGAIRGFEESALGFVLHQGPICSDADATRQQLKKQLTKFYDADLRNTLQQLSAAEPDALSVRPLLRAADEPRYEPEADRGERLAARAATFPVRPQARVGSFSALVESDHKRARPSPAAEPEPLDRDAQARDQPAETEVVPVASVTRVALADLPAGASFGHLVHGIYERADFQVKQASELRALVASCLSEFGGDSSWEPALSSAIFDSLNVQLSAAGGELPRLAAVPPAQRLNELEFVFPVADAADGALVPRRLGQLLAAHARDVEERAYADQLGRLRFSPLRGFLRGFIDLALEHDGRFYVIDYKSNRLGEHADDYQRPRMLSEMRRHHYVLQYLLYSVALHRYLSLRLPGYSYEQHFGGVYYLFVRGMSVAHAPGSGVLFERPACSLIEELSACLRSPELRV